MEIDPKNNLWNYQNLYAYLLLPFIFSTTQHMPAALSLQSVSSIKT